MTSGEDAVEARLLRGVAADWGLELEGPVQQAPRPSVPVRTPEGLPGLLEHAPDGSPYEHLALRAWEGHGAVRLLRADPRHGLLLTERTDPDDDLRRCDGYDAGTTIGSLFAALHRRPLPQPPALADLAPRWLDDLARPAVATAVPRRFVDQVRAWTPGLVDAREADPVLLHGDLRAATARRASDGRWVAVAPRPLVGDPAFEVAAVLRPWSGAEASDDLRGDLLERFYAVIDAAGLDEDRARAWVVIRTVVELAARFETDHPPTDDDVTWAMTVVKAVQR